MLARTLLIAGIGRIGSRPAALAKAFDMRVIAIRRDPSKGAGAADKVVGEEGLLIKRAATRTTLSTSYWKTSSAYGAAKPY